MDREAGERRGKVKLFTLLIDGEDHDTGKYEYFPYSDMVIANFKATYQAIAAIKKNQNNFNETIKSIYARYCIGDDATNNKAIESAYRASQNFRYFPVSVRRKILGDIHNNLVSNREKLIELFVIEGHPRKLAEWEFSGMEMAYREESLDYFKDELWTEVGKCKNETMYLLRKPDGVVCVSPPKNAPCSNSLTAGFALLGGNTVIVKPPLRSPLSTIFLWKEIVWKAARDNGAPDGTISIVLGNSQRIMNEWIESPLVNDIIFFGNSEKGLEIGKKIYMAGKKPILELSGNDIMAIWKDANLTSAAEALLDAFLGSTQICMVPKAALIHSSIFDEFSRIFLSKVKGLKVGLPSDSETCLTPVLKIKEFYKCFEDAKRKGAKVLCGGRRVNHKGDVEEKGLYITPTVVALEHSDDIWNIECLKEENFFPLIPLVNITGSTDTDIFGKMIKIININEYGLRTSLWVRSSFFVRKFIRYIHNSGLVRINSRHVGFSAYLSTHGGTGKTGGPHGELNYIWQKTTHLQGVSLTREKRTTLAKR